MKKGFIVAVSALSGAIIGAGASAVTVGKFSGETNKKVKKMSDKHLALFLMMNQWVKVKQEGKNLETYFERNGYQKIAIYGMSYAGETLFNELKDSNIQVAYAIDQKAEGIYADVDIVSPDAVLADVDAIVVTPIFFMDEIEEMLSSRISCPILSLEDILFEV